MNLDPKLNQADRIGSAVMGLGAVVYAFLGDFERVGARAALVAIGLAFVVGGVGGT